MIAPKQKYTTRPILLLDPIDYLLITGFVLRIAPKIESARILVIKILFIHVDLTVILRVKYFLQMRIIILM
jgi:hypothetical protein